MPSTIIDDDNWTHFTVDGVQYRGRPQGRTGIVIETLGWVNAFTTSQPMHDLVSVRTHPLVRQAAEHFADAIDAIIRKKHVDG